MTKHYPDIQPNPDFAALEQEMLKKWQAEGSFAASVEARAAQNDAGENNEYVFYDGPPFANGLPHYGHLLTGYVKDAIARYQTMRGKRVERRFGWDCHGLPAEMGAEKELGISGRQQIIDYGIEKFNAHCRSSVMKYAGEWEHYVSRQARWVDFEGDYKTMDRDYMESVLWAFKQLYDKGYIYDSQRVMAYSWAAETPLSNFETKLDNSYRDRTDKAVTVAFELKERPEGAPDADKYYLLAWTTTPWTLPSNLALAVSKELEYVSVCHSRESGNPEAKICYIATEYAANRLGKEFGCDDDEVKIDSRFRGNDLVGLSYKPLFPYFKNHPNAFRVLDGTSFIEEGSGTGVVHMAPGFGEDDQRVCAEAGIEIVCPVDEKGRYTEEVFDTPYINIMEDGSIETARCILRPPTEEDEKYFIALHTDETVMDTMNDGVLSLEEAKEDFAKNLKHFEEHSYGQWVATHKETGEFMGRAGLTYVAQSEEVEPLPTVRCALLPEFWHGGYGGELCTASLQWGFEQRGFEKIAGGAVPHNPRAHAMMKRIGMTHVKDVMFKRMIGPYFLITQEEFYTVNPPLSLRGLNVVAQAEGKFDGEPYTKEQLKKYGLANLRVINWLKLKGNLITQDDYTHSYPHCWRTDTPLIYRAMPSWYVAVTKFRDRAVELNKEINWIPEHIRDGQMGHMLATAPDWSISRNRFWGTPIPIWRTESGKIKAFGSIAELEEFFGKKVDDLHRPFIDELTKEEIGETWRRVTDVFDCWFESGSMPFAQVHYPFENKEWFETHFPADFITEYVGQTRGWFNTLIILATALFDKPPFKNCICHGVVLDSETGLKYSKRLKNYKNPLEVIDQFGADALRWLMLNSPVMRGHDLSVDPEGKFIRDVVRLHIKPIWNAYNFFTLYANADGVKAEYNTDAKNLMDRYILAKCRDAVEAVKEAMDAYDTPAACAAISDFFEVLNNWYIRRNKERFWNESSNSVDQAAFNTLYTVLITMCKATAALLPFTCESIYSGLMGNDHSIHLADFPASSVLPEDAELIEKMDRVRDVCNTALSIRSKQNIRVRQPLNELRLEGVHADSIVKFGGDLICDEVNAKTIVTYNTDIAEIAEIKLQLNNKILGKRLPHLMKQIIPASKRGEWEPAEHNSVKICGEILQRDEYDIRFEPNEAYKYSAAALSTNDALVVLDLDITPELAREGVARDLVRMVQEARKQADLHVSNRINLLLQVAGDTAQAIDEHAAYIKEQTLATSLTQGNVVEVQHRFEQELAGQPVVIGLSVAA